MGKVVVVGSTNVDLFFYVPNLPQVGETVHGSRFVQGFGGKGANQAIMSGLLMQGVEGAGGVVMVTKVGDDDFGRTATTNFVNAGVSTDFVQHTKEAETGCAVISVDDQGRNNIIVVGGANDKLTTQDVLASKAAFENASVVVCQLEVPVETTLEALRLGKEHGATTVFNPAPARDDIPKEIYNYCDYVCPNETEASLLTGLPVATEGEQVAAAHKLREMGAKNVIMTLGGDGCLLVSEGEVVKVSSEKVSAVDTSGAGDCFLGTFSYFISQGVAAADAIKRAGTVATMSVQRRGTQASYPKREEIAKEIINL